MTEETENEWLKESNERTRLILSNLIVIFFREELQKQLELAKRDKKKLRKKLKKFEDDFHERTGR